VFLEEESVTAYLCSMTVVCGAAGLTIGLAPRPCITTTMVETSLRADVLVWYKLKHLCIPMEVN